MTFQVHTIRGCGLHKIPALLQVTEIYRGGEGEEERSTEVRRIVVVVVQAE